MKLIRMLLTLVFLGGGIPLVQACETADQVAIKMNQAAPGIRVSTVFGDRAEWINKAFGTQPGKAPVVVIGFPMRGFNAVVVTFENGCSKRLIKADVRKVNAMLAFRDKGGREA